MDPLDVDRARFVTTRFRELQGLWRIPPVVVALWIIWEVGPYGRLLATYGPAEVIPGLLLLVAPWLMLACTQPLLESYYSRRFGLVARCERWWPERFQQGLFWAAVVADAFWRPGRPSVFLTLLGILRLRAVVRDWPSRAYLGAEVFACFAASYLLSVAPATSGGVLDPALRGPLTALILTFIVTGLLDHRLLARTLPCNPSADADVDAAEQVE